MMPTAEAKVGPRYIGPPRKGDRRALTSRRRDVKRFNVGVHVQLVRAGEKEWKHATVKIAVMTRHGRLTWKLHGNMQ